MDDIQFIITGGTIDCEYFPPQERPRPLAKTILPHYLRDKVKLYPPVRFEEFCMLDSDDINDQHRKDIAEFIQSSSSRKIIITHGTNTMDKTARFLDDAQCGADKTVILTGAMIPLKEFSLSDGGFNLGYAIAQVDNLKSGVYICIHGQTFKPHGVTKNRAEARFEEI